MPDPVPEKKSAARLIDWCIFCLQCLWYSGPDPRKLFLFFSVKPYTQLGYRRLANIYELAARLEKEGLKGDFVECGVWKGGAAAVLAYQASRAKPPRKVWLIDSFAGMPEPTGQDGPMIGKMVNGRTEGRLHPVGINVASLEQVEKLLFGRFGFARDKVVLVKGWFQEVLPGLSRRIGDIALLRIDADWYESTKVCLSCLYDSVVSGGYVIIDDYNLLPGCKNAVDEFMRERGLRVDLAAIDREGVYFRKK